MDATGTDRQLMLDMMQTVQRIDTKLTIVCGPDGSGGRLAQQEDRIRSLEDTRTSESAVRHFAKAAWVLVSGVLVWVLDHFLRGAH